MTDGERLRHFLNKHKISQLRFAQALGTNQPKVSRFCTGKRFQRDTIPRMNEALNRLTGKNQVWFAEKDSGENDRT